jgi:acetyl-CoA C-acetyltransferase
MMNKVFIYDAKRTPMGSFMGELSSKTAVDLGVDAVKGITSSLDAAAIQEIVMGCVLPAGLAQAPARQVAIHAGLSNHIHASTVNKVCGSGLMAIMMMADSIQLGRSTLGIAGGMESMSNAPYLLPKVRQGYKYGHTQLMDHMAFDGLEDAYERGVSMGVLAERLAESYAFSREAQDAYAISSTTKAQQAMESGAFQSEIVPITIDGKTPYTMEHDEGPRKAKPDKIPQLRPAFKKDGTITAAASSPISDGAAALLLGSEAAAKHHGLMPRAVIKAYASYSHEPQWFTTAPVNAIQQALDLAGWSVGDVDLFEINEAFAVVPMAAMRDLKIPAEKVNINGGALVLGHPLGASGARVVVTLLHALERNELKKGIAALCIGGGEGVAIAIELI